MTEFTETEVVYLGSCLLAGGKQGARWMLKYALDQIDEQDQQIAFDLARRVSSPYGKKTGTGKVIGGVYKVEAQVEGDYAQQMRSGTLSYVGRSDHFLIPAFEADDILARQADRRRLAEERAKKDPVIMRELQSTVVRLRKLPYRQRIEAVDAIRSTLLDIVLKGAR